jgi:hypothetical protein
MARRGKEDKNLSLVELIFQVMNHPDCPGELYDAMSDSLSSLLSSSGSKDTKAWRTAPWHITYDVANKDWNAPEGLKTLCGSKSQKIIRVQFFDIFWRTHKEKDFCERCLEIFRQRTTQPVRVKRG